MTFHNHMNWLLKKANENLHPLICSSKYANQEKLRIFLKTCIESQFNFSVLLFGCVTAEELDVRINKLHEKAPSLVPYYRRN